MNLFPKNNYPNSSNHTKMAVLIFFVLHWYLSLFVQTFFLHRYAAHNMFTMSKTSERFFYIFTFICQGSSYLSPRAYGIMHRMHHVHADTEHDPHSPKYDKSIVAMMMRTFKVFKDIFRENVKIEPQYEKGVPDWSAFDKMASSGFARIFWITFYVAFYYFFATHWLMYLLIPIHIGMGPVHGVIVNWFAHKFGYSNFEMENTSVNLMPWDIFMMGEGLHNNHHRNATRANFGYKQYEFDPTYPIILLLDKLNIIQLRKY